MTRTRILSLAGVLLALALAAVVNLQAHRAAATDDARAAALAAAKSRVPTLLSYDRATLEDDLARAVDQTTGSFSDDYKKILTDVVEPTAKRRGISTTASVSAAGVVSGDSDKVVVLVFLTQTTTAAGGGSSVTGSRVEVTMEPSGGDWKIAGLEPV
jgi:Mce-associated membrane protein